MGTQSPSLKRGRNPLPIFGPFLLWPNGSICIKMPLGMDVDLSPGDFVLDGDTVLPPLPNQGGGAPSQFSAHFYCAQTAGCIKMPLGMEVGLSPGTPTPPQLWPMSIVAKWLKTPLGTAVDLGPGHIVLDTVPASSREKGTAPPLFSAHVYCGHGRPSQLLLSSCFHLSPT